MREGGTSVNQGGHLNVFGAFRAVGDWSLTTLNTSHFTDGGREGGREGDEGGEEE
jgi:hypothetical protein